MVSMFGLLKRCLMLGAAVFLLALVDQTLARAEVDSDIYTLGARDKLRITVFGENDLSGEFEVDSAGWISMPLIGEIRATGLTARQLEEAVRTRLLDGYLKNPLVNSEVLSHRPFIIDGEVDRPGEYPIRLGMNVREAVAVAGGYKLGANKDIALVTRRDDPNGRKMQISLDELVRPGDYLWIRK